MTFPLHCHNETLQSGATHLQPTLDMRNNLEERENRLKDLCRLLNEHDLVGTLSVQCRESLLADLEKIAVGIALWQLNTSEK